MRGRAVDAPNRPLAVLPYRPRIVVAVVTSLFFGLGGIVLVDKAQETGDWFDWVLVATSFGFVVLGALMLGLRFVRPQQVEVWPGALVVPRRWWSSDTVRIVLDTVEDVQIVAISGQVMVKVLHDGQRSGLQRQMFDTNADFDRVMAFLDTGEWSGEVYPGETPDSELSAEATRLGRASGPLRGLGFKLGGLFSFCGGPLRLADRLSPEIGGWAFALAFLPVGLMIFGAMSALDEEPTPFWRAVVAAGGLGAAVVGALSVWALVDVAMGTWTVDDVIVTWGSVVALVVTVAYGVVAARFFQQPAV